MEVVTPRPPLSLPLYLFLSLSFTLSPWWLFLMQALVANEADNEVGVLQEVQDPVTFGLSFIWSPPPPSLWLIGSADSFFSCTAPLVFTLSPFSC